MIQFELGDLIWILVGLFIGLASFAGFLWLPKRKPGREHPSDAIGAILVHSETPELLLVRYDLTGRMSFISQGVHAILGYNPEEFTSGKLQIRSFVDLADLQVLESAETARQEGNTQDLQYQYRIRRQDGRWHWMHERQEAIRDESGKIVGFETLAIDFTDRIRFEKQQRRLRELQRLLTSVLEGLVEWEDSPSDLGSTLELLVRYLPLTGASILAIDDNRTSAKEVASATRRSGRSRPGMPMDGEAAAWWIRSISGAVSLVIHRGRLSEIEPRIRDKIAAEVDGSVVSIPLFIDGELRYALILQGPNDDQSLEPEEASVVQAIVHAISRRLENAEIRREREEFRELRAKIERSEAIAHFVSGILHDFNNLIFAVSGKISLMLRKIDDPAICGSLEEIRESIVDAGGIVKRLQRAERLGLDEPDIIDPCLEMLQIIRTSQRLLPKRIRFESDIRPMPSGARKNMIRAVPQALQQLVLNLMVNSRDAVGMHGRIRITSGPSPDNQYFELCIDDDGPGIPEDQREAVFEPYMSTKSPEKGTGLGLSICRRVVSDAKGTLVLEDSPLGGLRATARFQLVEGAPHVEEQLEESDGEIEGMIFLIEDNDTIRDVLVRELESSGATVVSRSDAMDAEKVIGLHGNEIQLLLFDIDLPIRTGIECLISLRKSGVETPCLLITGGTSDAPEISATDLLRKPFRTTTLLDTCKELIGRSKDTSSN